MRRIYAALMLSLMLALTSHSSAVARTMPDAVGQMIICTGLGTTLVYTDANGQPTDVPHLCPDCVVHLVAATVPTAATVPAFSEYSVTRRSRHADSFHLQKPSHGFAPRGPPFAV